MARDIPSYEQLLLPVLQHAADRVWRMRDLIGRIADELGLSAEERQVLLHQDRDILKTLGGR